MKKVIAACVITMICLLSYCSHKEEGTRVVAIVSDHKQVSSDILKLLELTGVFHDGTLADIVTQTQRFWLRKPGQERWDIEQYVTDNESEIRSVFEEMSMCGEIKPKLQEYDYVLILGGLFGRMTARLQHTIDLFKQGVRFKKIVLLGSARPAVATQGETLQKYLEWSGQSELEGVEPQTEADMLKFIYQYSAMPDQMRQLPMQVIDVPMLGQEGALRRPTTGDTITWWLQTDPQPGTCLFVSSQPYVGYQDSVVKTDMPADFSVDTVGLACDSSKNIGILLDTVARWLYQEQNRLQST